MNPHIWVNSLSMNLLQEWGCGQSLMEVCFLHFEKTGRICFFPTKLVISVTAIFWNHQFDLWVRTLSYHIRNFHSVILSNKFEAIFSFSLYISNLHRVCTRFALEMKNIAFKMTNTEHRTFVTTKKKHSLSVEKHNSFTDTCTHIFSREFHKFTCTPSTKFCISI